MRKPEMMKIIQKAAKEEGIKISLKDLSKLYDICLYGTVDVAIEEGEVRTCIGTFKIKQNKETNVRDLRTHEIVKIPAKKVLRYSPSTGVKEDVSNL